MNIGSLMSGKKDKKEKTQEAQDDETPGESYGNEHISISEVLKVWPVMAEKLAAELPLLHSTLLWKAPQLLDNYVISICIENPLQYDEIFRHKNEITLFLRKELKNDQVSVTTELIEGVKETRRPYTDNEKFDFIADKAPVLKIMKDQLGLELDM
jgi:DNA polymerase-3 subunit gamma/tau